MAQNAMYEPPPQIPKRRTPWFTKLLFAFALLMVVLIVYGFVRAKPAVPTEQTELDRPTPPVAGDSQTRRETRNHGWWSAAAN